MLFSIGDTTVMFIVIPACSVFDSNECVSGGIVNVFQYSIEFQGRNIFVNNIGPVLQVCMCGHYACVSVSVHVTSNLPAFLIF